MAEAQEFPFESEEWAKRANPDYIDALARKDPRLRLHGAELHSHWSPKGIFFLVDAGPDHVQHTPDDEIVRVSTNKWIKK